ncbi:MAG: class I tRNA ligase family protein [Hyphomonadaceae bacterium]
MPLPIFVSKADGSILQDDEVDARIVTAMRKGGADVWWATPAQDFLGNAYKAEDYEKVEDILDVWFDSGSTHAFVIGNPDAPKRPSFANPVSTLYLEGSDQHRGWFHSSLLESCATRGRAPYDEVLTHGFTMDERRAEMSSPSATSSSRRRWRSRTASKSCASPSPPPSTATTCAWAKPSSIKPAKPTASCATRCAICWGR